MSEEQFQNSLCRDIGHDWRATTAPNYRVCSRGNCKAAQRFHQGTWVTVPSRSTGKKRTLSPIQPGQAGFSSGNTLFDEQREIGGSI